MNENSLFTHRQNLFEGTYKDASEAILKAYGVLKQGTMKDIANHLGVELNRISGRFGEMRKSGKIEEIGKVKINNRFNSVYKLKV